MQNGDAYTPVGWGLVGVGFLLWEDLCLVSPIAMAVRQTQRRMTGAEENRQCDTRRELVRVGTHPVREIE